MPFFKYIPAKTNLLVALLVPFLFLLSNFVYAQKWYQVEVLVFTQSDSFGDETSLPEAKLKYPLNWVELAAAGSNNKFTAVNKTARRLNPDAYTLNSTGVYKVLYHQAWRQPGISPRNAPWLIVSGGRTLGDHRELEGSIRLHLSSYLHLETNLWLLNPANNASTVLDYSSPGQAGFRSKRLSTNDVPISPLRSKGNQSSGAFGGGPAYGLSGSTRSPAIELSRIDALHQSERLQLGKTHYLDHPKMGVLIKVVRTKAPGAAATASPAPLQTSPLQPSPLKNVPETQAP
ncbi:MAG: peptidoglycan binding protein CsiV [Porticoccaceae bacterium]|nr:peptidoglycan binding protein CsiV [Porticoccaceae bacterium]